VVNKCIFVGTLGRDPESNDLSDGSTMCKFSIALNESYKKKSGEKVKKTEWINVVAFRKLAEICQTYLNKGSQVFLECKVQTREWQDKDGNNRKTTEFIAQELKMLGGKKGNDEQSETLEFPAESSATPLGDGVPF